MTSNLPRKMFFMLNSLLFQVQLTVTFGIMTLFVYHEPTKVWVKRHPGNVHTIQTLESK